MSKNDPIFCFNGHECIYVKCGMYDDTVSICGIERLKTVNVKEAAKPSQVQAAQQVPKSQTPWVNPNPPEVDMEKLIQEEMAKAAGLLTREAAEYIVKQELAKKNKQPAQQGKKPFTDCKDVVDGMKNFKVHGRIVGDPVQQELKTKKGPMTVVKALLDDGTSQLRITFWDLNKVPAMKAGEEITVEGLMGSVPYDGLPQASGGQYTKVIFEKV